MAHKFKQVIYAGQKLVDESGGGGGAVTVVDTPDEHGGTIREITAVNIDEALEEGSATPSETAQTLTPSEGKLGFSEVTVGAVSSDYVGTGVARKTSSDLSQSGATVTAPAGYYENDATKTLDEQTAQTIHPSTTDQTIASGKYLTGAQTIKAVTTTNLTAANIVSGVTVEIGDADDSDCVASVTGTASGGSIDWDDVVNKTYQYGDVTLDSVTSWTGYPIFKGVSGITGITATVMVTAGSTGASDAFEGCSNLVYAFFPEATTIGRDFVRSCGKLEYFAAPKATTIGAESLRQSGKLKAADLGLITDIQTRTFYGVSYTADIILRSSTVASIASNAVPGSGSAVHVYVPSSLISTYETETNWSTGVGTGAITFYALENSIYESTTWWQNI